MGSEAGSTGAAGVSVDVVALSATPLRAFASVTPQMRYRTNRTGVARTERDGLLKMRGAGVVQSPERGGRSEGITRWRPDWVPHDSVATLGSILPLSVAIDR